MYKFIIIFLILLIAICCLPFLDRFSEHFDVWDYEPPLTPFKYRDTCPITGTIEEINPTISYCYSGYNIPFIFNVGTYESEVNPDA